MGAKYKPNKGCVKRFKVTATGKVKRRGTMSTHLRSVRDGNMKRRLGRPAILAEGHARNVRYYMGMSGKNPSRAAHDRAAAAAQGVPVETAAA